MIRPVRCCQMMQETKTSQIIMWNQIPCSGSINFFDMNSEELLSYGLLKFSVFPVLVLWRGIDIRKKWALQSKGVSFALRSTCNSITYSTLAWDDTKICGFEAVVTSIVQIEAWYLEGVNILLKSSCIHNFEPNPTKIELVGALQSLLHKSKLLVWNDTISSLAYKGCSLFLRMVTQSHFQCWL